MSVRFLNRQLKLAELLKNGGRRQKNKNWAVCLSGKILQTDSFIKYYLERQPKGRKRSRGQTTKETKQEGALGQDTFAL